MSLYVKSSFNKFAAFVGQYFPDENLRSVLRGAAVAFAIRSGGAAAGCLSQLLLARWMGAFEFGIYMFAIAWLVLLSNPAALGIPSATIRFVAQYTVADKWPEIRGLLRVGWIVTFSAGLLFSAVSLGILYAQSKALETYYLVPLAIALSAIPLDALVKLKSEAARAFRWVTLAYMPSQLAFPLLIIAAAVVLLQNKIDVSAAVMVVATIAALFVVLVWLETALRLRLGTRLFKGNARYETKLWLSVSTPLMFTGVFSIIMTQTDIVMIGLLLEPQYVAYYSAAAKTAILVTFSFQAIISLTVPKIGELYALERRNELQHFLSSLIHWIFWPSLFVAVALVVFGYPLLALFGPGFETSYIALLILIFGQVVHAAVGPVLGLLSMTGHQKLCAKVFAVSAAVNVILNAILIPVAGISGAAIATATSVAIWNIWLLIAVMRKLDLYPSLLMSGAKRPRL